MRIFWRSCKTPEGWTAPSETLGGPGVGPRMDTAKAPNQVIGTFGHGGAKPGQAALRAELYDPETVWTQP